jgi:hypothetical protein
MFQVSAAVPRCSSLKVKATGMLVSQRCSPFAVRSEYRYVAVKVLWLVPRLGLTTMELPVTADAGIGMAKVAVVASSTASRARRAVTDE